MTNKYYSVLFFLLSGITILAQPSKQMLNSIPAETYCTISLNTTNINEKVDFDRIKALPVIKNTFDELKKGARKDSVALKKFYDNPNTLGIALEPSVTAFFHVTELENEDPIYFMAAAVPLSNKMKFEALLKAMMQAKYDEVKQGNGYKYIPNKKTYLAWNKEFVVFYMTFSSSGKHLIDDHLDAFFKGDKKKSLMNHTDFAQFSKRKKDFGVWLDVKKGWDLYMSTIGRYGMAPLRELGINNFGPKMSSLGLDLNFNDEHISLTTRSIIDEEIKELTAKNYASRIDEDMLKYVSSENLLGFAGLSTDMKATKEFYEQEYQSLYDSAYNVYSKLLISDFVDDDSTIKVWREQLYGDDMDVVFTEEAVYEDEEQVFEVEAKESKEGLTWEERDSIKTLISERSDSLKDFYFEGRDSIINHYLGKYDLKQDDLWNVLTGDLLLASNGTFQIIDTFKTYEYIENQDGEWAYEEVEKTRKIPVPLIKLLVGVNYPQSVKSMLNDLMIFFAKSGGTFNYEKKGDYFVVDAAGYTKVYVGVLADKYLLITNNKDFVNNVGDKGYDKNLRMASVHDPLTKEGPSFFFLDISKALKISEKGAPQQIDMLRILQKTFINLTISASLEKGNPLGETQIKMGKEHNTLEQLFELSNDIYLYYTSFR